MENTIIVKNEKTVATFNNAFSKLLTTKDIKTFEQARENIFTALAIDNKTKYPICKTLAIIREKQLYKPQFKNFEKACETLNLGRSTINNYAKVGLFVNESGLNSVFAKTTENGYILDFEYSTLQYLLEKASKYDGKKLLIEETIQEVNKMIEEEIIQYHFKKDDIKPLFDLKNLENIGGKATIKEETTEEKTEEKTEEEKITETIKKSSLYKSIDKLLVKAVQKALNENIKDIKQVIKYMLD